MSPRLHLFAATAMTSAKKMEATPATWMPRQFSLFVTPQKNSKSCQFSLFVTPQKKSKSCNGDPRPFLSRLCTPPNMSSAVAEH